MDLSIIIVSWNTCQELINCIQSILDGTQDLDYEIILVDNASTDGTVAAIKKRFSQIKVIANNENNGFPKANNQGITISQGEYILLLNPDTVVPPSTLQKCVVALCGRPEAGILGCRLTYPDGRPQYEAGRRFPTLWDWLAESFYLHIVFPKSRIFNGYLMGEWDHADDCEVDCLSGAFMLFRRAALDEVGLLNEQVFMYYEDLEMCHRLKNAGWKVWFLGTQSVIHISGKSSSKSNLPLWLLEGDIKCRLMKMLYGEKAALACRAIIGMRSVVRLVIGLLLYIPAWLLGKTGKTSSLFMPLRNLRLLQWSILPGSVEKYFPGMVLKS